MSDTKEVTYDWWSYAKIGGLILLIIIGLVAMFTPSKTPVSQSLSTMQAALQGGVVGAVPQGPGAAADLPAWWILLFTGFAIGCYGTIVGIGGGPIILPLLVFFYGWENELLVATSLFIVFLNAGSGCLGYSMQKRIDYKGGIKFTLAAMPGALISSFTHHLINLTFFNVIFGIFLIFLAFYTIFSINNLDKSAEQEKVLLKEAKAGG